MTESLGYFLLGVGLCLLIFVWLLCTGFIVPGYYKAQYRRLKREADESRIDFTSVVDAYGFAGWLKCSCEVRYAQVRVGCYQEALDQMFAEYQQEQLEQSTNELKALLFPAET